MHLNKALVFLQTSRFCTFFWKDVPVKLNNSVSEQADMWVSTSAVLGVYHHSATKMFCTILGFFFLKKIELKT